MLAPPHHPAALLCPLLFLNCTMRNIISAAERRQCAKTPQVRCPVRIFHGAQDGVVPTFVAQEVVNWLESRDVHLTMIQGGDHRLSRPEDLRSLVGTCRCRSLPDAHAHAHAHTRTHAHTRPRTHARTQIGPRRWP